MLTSRTGRILGDRYVIGLRLGSGSVTDVYEAQDRQLERQVAVKLLRPEAAADPAIAAGFQHEAELAAGLHHPHLARVYDAGTQDGVPYIVMERVAGTPLPTDRPLAVGQAVNIGTQIAGALAFVHDQGLVHWDVKPANILVAADGQAKLVDFGVPGTPDDTATLGTAVADNTPRPAANPPPNLDALPYLAPERRAGAPPAPAADVYSLGAVLYTLLAGRPPAAGAPAPLRQLNPAVPPALESLVARALAPDPAARFGSAAEMESAMEAVRAQGRDATAAFVADAAPGAAMSFVPTGAASAAPRPPAVPGAPPAPLAAAEVPTDTGAPMPPAVVPYRPAVPADSRAPLAAPAAPRPAAVSAETGVLTPAPAAPYRPALPPDSGTHAPDGSLVRRWALPVIAGALILGLLTALAALIAPGPVEDTVAGSVKTGLTAVPTLAAALPGAPGATPSNTAPAAAPPTTDLAGAATAAPATPAVSPTAAQAAAPPTSTAVPSTPTSTVPLRPVPDLTGLTLAEAQARTKKGGWSFHAVSGAPSTKIRAGRVVSQQPEAGTPLAAGAPIRVVYSTGPARP